MITTMHQTLVEFKYMNITLYKWQNICLTVNQSKGFYRSKSEFIEIYNKINILLYLNDVLRRFLREISLNLDVLKDIQRAIDVSWFFVLRVKRDTLVENNQYKYPIESIKNLNYDQTTYTYCGLNDELKYNLNKLFNIYTKIQINRNHITSIKD